MDLYSGEYVDPMYQAKSRIINHSIQDIGMGKYQWCLFAAAGFGWFADSVWPSFSGLILAPAMYEFHFNGSLLALALNIGLLVGGLVWGLYGRWPFNITLLIAGIFGVAAGASPNFVSLAVLMSFVGLGVGGNVPVDAAVFLDFVPSSHQYLLTILSIWWCMGQLLGNLITWPLISNFTCTSATDCDRSSNMGWRYLLFTLGGLMLLWSLRFFVFSLLENPRFLCGIGKDAEAVDVICKLAECNGQSCSLTVEDLEAPGKFRGFESSHGSGGRRRMLSEDSGFAIHHIKALFTTTTSLLIAVWGAIGLSSALYNNFLPYMSVC